MDEPKLKFGDKVENIAASDDNPIKLGIFVRYMTPRMAEYVTEHGGHKTPADNLRLAAQSAAPIGCICQEQHRRGYCTEPGCSFAAAPVGPCTQAELDAWIETIDSKNARLLLMWKERAEKAEAALSAKSSGSPVGDDYPEDQS